MKSLQYVRLYMGICECCIPSTRNARDYKTRLDKGIYNRTPRKLANEQRKLKRSVPGIYRVEILLVGVRKEWVCGDVGRGGIE